MEKIKSLEEYQERVTDWFRRIDNYIQIQKAPRSNTFFAFTFINEQYREMFLPSMQKDICVFKDGRAIRLVFEQYICIQGSTHISYFDPPEQKYIYDWFHKYYPLKEFKAETRRESYIVT